jgi:hypothetical protein
MLAGPWRCATSRAPRPVLLEIEAIMNRSDDLGRSHGCRDLLVYHNTGRCHHNATTNADWLPDETPVRSLCRRMVCTRCGNDPGTDVRPDWGPHVNK